MLCLPALLYTGLEEIGQRWPRVVVYVAVQLCCVGFGKYATYLLGRGAGDVGHVRFWVVGKRCAQECSLAQEEVIRACYRFTPSFLLIAERGSVFYQTLFLCKEEYVDFDFNDGSVCAHSRKSWSPVPRLLARLFCRLTSKQQRDRVRRAQRRRHLLLRGEERWQKMRH